MGEGQESEAVAVVLVDEYNLYILCDPACENHAYVHFCVNYTSFVRFKGFPIVSCSITKSFINTLHLDKILTNFVCT